LRTLKNIDEQVSLSQSRSNPAILAEMVQTPSTMLQIPSKRSVFSLPRPKSTSKTTKGSAASSGISLFSKKTSSVSAHNFRMIDASFSENPPGPEEWERVVYHDSQAISHFFGYEER